MTNARMSGYDKNNNRNIKKVISKTCSKTEYIKGG